MNAETFLQPETFHLGLSFDPAKPSVDAFKYVQLLMRDFSLAETDGSILLVWGTPADQKGIIAATALLRKIEAMGIGAVASDLDCSFLLVHYDKRKKEMAIVTDRWGSLPLYYCEQQGVLQADTSFRSLSRRRGVSPERVYDRWTVGEFLYFRRLFGTRTFDPDIKFLPYGTMLVMSQGENAKLHRYWNIDAEKSSLDQGSLSVRLADAIRDAMRLYSSDGKRYGLMLSGGLDARALLAAADRPLVCFTTSPMENNELAVARALATMAGDEHVYMPKPKHLPANALETSVDLSGGSTVYHEAQFLGYAEFVQPRADTIFMGLALDIMFCGHYLPKKPAEFGGRQGLHFRMQELPRDLEATFVNTVSYRLKTSDPLMVIRGEFRNELRDQLRERVREEMDEGRAFGLEAYDLWEFMHLRNFARHYSMLMAQSVRTFAACRIPAFTRELYDICWSMRAEDKANWRVYQKAIRRMNPEMMKVRNANTNIRADRPLWQQSVTKFARSLAMRIPGVYMQTAPQWQDRSWPLPRKQLEDNPNLLQRASMLGHSEVLASLRLFDMEAIGRVVDDHLASRADHTVLLNMLQTIDEAMR
jgi:asparagine synthase (glutamine-hydrolysing)